MINTSLFLNLIRRKRRSESDLVSYVGKTIPQNASIDRALSGQQYTSFIDTFVFPYLLLSVTTFNSADWDFVSVAVEILFDWHFIFSCMCLCFLRCLCRSKSCGYTQDACVRTCVCGGDNTYTWRYTMIIFLYTYPYLLSS